ncbi:protein kinase [Kitasatospora sp. NPDC004723]|uniref:protein kinase n=1 Tax=Kitasatospora sp. NPDC004723 TaxID=3154288 RepID=UPI0033BB11D1
MRAGPGQVLAGRYRLTDRPEALSAFAVDERSGDVVRLRAWELPASLIGDQEPDGSGPVEGERLVRRVAAVGAAAPRHPRLLQGVGAFVEGDRLWTVEERQAGRPLAALLADGPLPPYRAAEVAADLAAALRALHDAGLAHGNLTAGSVLVCEDGAALLGGLLPGVAEEVLAEELGGPGGRRRYEVRAELVGSVAERWPLDGGPAGDCWALGVLLHRMVTGRAPYPESGVPELVTAVREGRRVPSEACGPLGPLVERLLQPDPARRPTAAEVRLELAELLAGAPEPAAGERVAPPLPEQRRAPGRRGGVKRDSAAKRDGAAGAERPRAEASGPDRPPRIPPALLGPVLVGGVFLLLLLGVVAVVLFAG